MIVNVYHNGKHSCLEITTADIEEIIARCGWTVLNDAEDVTDEERTEIARLEALPYTSCADRTTQDALAWWNARLIFEKPALTPDM
jgi:hypothetical protein